MHLAVQSGGGPSICFNSGVITIDKSLKVDSRSGSKTYTSPASIIRATICAGNDRNHDHAVPWVCLLLEAVWAAAATSQLCSSLLK